MAERPILFSDPMVRAILDGRKTVTRRIVKPNLKGTRVGCYTDASGVVIELVHVDEEDGDVIDAPGPRCPYGQSNDILWVREAYGFDLRGDPVYRANLRDLKPADGKWRPSIFMPKTVSRIALAVRDVTVERLHDITEAEARLEGFDSRSLFKQLWCNLNGDESWNANPLVWRVSFHVLP